MEQIIKIWNQRMHFSQHDKDMNLNTAIILFISTIFLNSCADYKVDRKIQRKENQKRNKI